MFLKRECINIVYLFKIFLEKEDLSVYLDENGKMAIEINKLPKIYTKEELLL